MGQKQLCSSFFLQQPDFALPARAQQCCSGPCSPENSDVPCIASPGCSMDAGPPWSLVWVWEANSGLSLGELVSIQRMPHLERIFNLGSVVGVPQGHWLGTKDRQMHCWGQARGVPMLLRLGLPFQAGPLTSLRLEVCFFTDGFCKTKAESF